MKDKSFLPLIVIGFAQYVCGKEEEQEIVYGVFRKDCFDRGDYYSNE